MAWNCGIISKFGILKIVKVKGDSVIIEVNEDDISIKVNQDNLFAEVNNLFSITWYLTMWKGLRNCLMGN